MEAGRQRVESEESGEGPVFRRIFIDGKGRSVAGALAFFWVGYSLSVVSAVLYFAGAMARGLGGASDPSGVVYFESMALALGSYLGFTVAVVSQSWYLLLKPYWEKNELRKLIPLLCVLATFLILIPPTALYSLPLLSVLNVYTPGNGFLFRRLLWVNFYLGAAFLLFGPVHIIGLAGYRYAYGRGDSADPSQ